ncbi:hypothetical protein ANCDUO_12860 [Ancylostoma duodenale]|uniref:Uncharacterized protein n=1 Tax=Ancylostoma duodenale TaxID=51022 RepID=A0A0C2GIQ4_9BILA|nr:hypothetical protein ANCDUO_12860 [Ancylostoma duodenale]
MDVLKDCYSNCTTSFRPFIHPIVGPIMKGVLQGFKGQPEPILRRLGIGDQMVRQLNEEDPSTVLLDQTMLKDTDECAYLRRLINMGND